MKITVSHNFQDIQKKLDELHTDVASRAMASALNKTTAQAKTAMSREIRAEFNLTAAKVNESLRVNRAVSRRGIFELEASLESPSRRGRSFNLINFMEKFVTLSQAKKRGKIGTLRQLHVRIKRNGAPIPLRTAFIGNKGRTVFMRVGKDRLPIKAMQTIDVAGMFNTQRISVRVLDMIHQKLPQIFENEARYFTNKFNNKR